MKKRILVPGILVAVLMIASFAMANPYTVGQGSHHGGEQHTVNHDQAGDGQVQQNVAARIAQMDAFLELDESQKAQIEEVLTTYWQNRQGNETEHTSRHGLMHSSDQDEATLRKVMVQHAELRADQIVKQRKLQKDLAAILTEEQQEKEVQSRNSRGHHGSDMHFGGHGS
ncbi:MAG: Spy/CpxP family protein refolding chaperone [Desulfuromonadales bacterium]